jgi:dTDP-glucose pyrophosphorylase
MNVIITMAGLGLRFRQRGFLSPKYTIQARGRSLFSWSLDSLTDFLGRSRTIFVALKRDAASEFIRHETTLHQLRAMEIVELDLPTDGQATTALLAASHLHLSEYDPILIYNIDTYVEPGYLRAQDIRGAGWVPCFFAEGTKWSFFAAAEDGRIVDAQEKVPISPHASIGCYYFESLQLYRETYQSWFSKPQAQPERYVAPMYRELIAQGKDVFMHLLPSSIVHGLGTPDDVRDFEAQAS